MERHGDFSPGRNKIYDKLPSIFNITPVKFEIREVSSLKVLKI